MNLKQELKESKRYEYYDDDNEMSFSSHKYRSTILFLEDVDMIQYVSYTWSKTEGMVLFEIVTDISLDDLEKIIDIVEKGLR